MKVNKIRMRETLVSYAFLAPILIFFIVFVLAPMIMGFVTSFFNYSMTSFKFVGLENYSRMFADKVFIKSLINTVIIVIGSVPIVVLFSLFVASQTYHQNAIARSFYRFVFFLPVVTGSVAVTVVWKWIYDPLSGILNFVLKSGHVINQNISWLGDKHWALMAIIIILLTTSVGQPIILYIAAMGNIDNSLVEAARVDGATEFQVFWKIKWPSLLPTTLYIAIITTINSFQCFALIQLLTSGGPNYSTSTLMYYLYEKAFKLSEYGYANTMGVFLAVMIAIISFAQFKILGNDVEYQRKEPQMKPTQKKPITAFTVISTIILLLLTVLFIFPFYWILTGAFKSQPDTIMIPPQWWPKTPTMENFQQLMVQNPALQWLWNSVFISLATMLLVCMTSSLAGYVLAKKRFYGQRILFAIFIAAMALPKQVVLVPLVRIINFMGIHDTLAAVILPLVGWPFGVFLMKQFSENIPTELLESAKIDGCGELRTFWSVAFPIVKPGFAALAIFTFINTWNDYFMQLVMLTSRQNLTISLGVATMQAEMATNYGLIMAGAALAAVPIVTVFLVFQKSFTQGITMGAVKG